LVQREQQGWQGYQDDGWQPVDFGKDNNNLGGKANNNFGGKGNDNNFGGKGNDNNFGGKGQANGGCAPSHNHGGKGNDDDFGGKGFNNNFGGGCNNNNGVWGRGFGNNNAGGNGGRILVTERNGATVNQNFGMTGGNGGVVKYCDCGNTITNPRYWACPRCYYHLHGGGKGHNNWNSQRQNGEQAPVTPPNRREGNGSWYSPDCHPAVESSQDQSPHLSSDPQVRMEQLRILREGGARIQANMQSAADEPKEDDETQEEYLAQMCRTYFTFPNLEKISQKTMDTMRWVCQHMYLQ